jgi:hypothetical protein
LEVKVVRDLTIIGLLAATSPVHAAGEVNCQILGSDNTPYICVHNNTDVAIENISCVGWFANSISIPKGRIPPGGVTVIKFDAGRCSKEIDFFGHNNSPVQVNKGFDFKSNSDLDVNR